MTPQEVKLRHVRALTTFSDIMKVATLEQAREMSALIELYNFNDTISHEAYALLDHVISDIRHALWKEERDDA